ncbi:MAG: helix-turn-helix domain-containing protein [Lentisphaerae bacterium]|nr:helix-turn-helix domain-containing protein [Lentisphaerota bacterium]
MVQSVQRALHLLELLDGGGASGCSLTELGAGSGLKAPTAHNLLGTLLALGYAEQDAATRRYRLGERARRLGSGRAVVARLKHAAAAAVRALHEGTNETVILAVDLDGQRHSILSCESRHELRVTASTGVDEHFYDTATGRVLLALRGPGAVGAIVARHGLPGPAWPEVADAASLGSALAGIRAAGEAAFSKPASHVQALAVPVRLPGMDLGIALGLFYPSVRDTASRRMDLLRRLHEAAGQIAVMYERI